MAQSFRDVLSSLAHHRSGSESEPHRDCTRRDTRLFDMDTLMADVQVSSEDRAWFRKVNVKVREVMNGRQYDASHDYEHVQRVVKELHGLWMAEKGHYPDVNPVVLYVAAMVHDIGDGKYLEHMEKEEDNDDDSTKSNKNNMHNDKDKSQKNDDKGYASLPLAPDAPLSVLGREAGPDEQEFQQGLLLRFLTHNGCPYTVAKPAAQIASFVSFTREVQYPEKMQQACRGEHAAALALVQDADRLDGLGAMGLARAALYGGVLASRRRNTILTLVTLIDCRLAFYPGLMKTRAGRREADRRMEWVYRFRRELLRQADCHAILEPLEGEGEEEKAEKEEEAKEEVGSV